MKYSWTIVFVLACSPRILNSMKTLKTKQSLTSFFIAVSINIFTTTLILWSFIHKEKRQWVLEYSKCYAKKFWNYSQVSSIHEICLVCGKATSEFLCSSLSKTEGIRRINYFRITPYRLVNNYCLPEKASHGRMI